MKKITIGIISILSICLVLMFGSKALDSASATGSKSLIVYNWGDYIDPSLIKKFERQTGYHVTYETFDSNEAMFTKVKQGGTNYDITIPSEYMITKMRKAKLLDKIDTKKLKNFHHLDSRFLSQPFDRHNQYSVPYFWGTLGIVYNDLYVKQGSITKWDDLWDKKFKNNILLVDSARDVMGFSLVSLGYSMNTSSSLQLHLAKTKLDGLGHNVKAIISDELKMYMIQDAAAVGVTWSGEASEMLAENPHLHYVVPSQGSNLWFDNFVIPKTAKHIDAAYKFIDFMLDPKNAAQNAEYIGYSTPNKTAMKYLPKSVARDPQFYPSAETIKHLQVYQDLAPEVVQEYNDLFLEFKMYSR